MAIRPRDRLRIWFKRRRAAVVVAAAILVVAAFVALLWRGAPWLDASRLRGLTPVQRESAIDAIRGRLLQLGAGLVVAVGLVYTGLTFRLSREGHVTDRYTKAIDQLGSERLDVRLGAIYALERIMIDSVRDHPTIVEVLAAYVREHAPLEVVTVVPAGEDPMQSTATESSAGPATDVQAALTVLARRPTRDVRMRVSLQRTKLTGADLTRAYLFGAYLTGADLRAADLRWANLRLANLIQADLSGAKLYGADLDGADLTGTYLSEADLAGAKHLARAKLPSFSKLALTKLTGGAQADAGADESSPGPAQSTNGGD